MAKDLAIILNNGSINSAVATALAVQKYRPIMLYAEAMQQPGSRARMAYDQQVGHFKPYREHTLSMPFLTALATDERRGATAADPRQQNSPRGPQMVELLPLVAAAARFAAHYQAAAIFLGLRIGNQADELAQGTEYVQVWNELIQLPCDQPELEIQAPLMEMEAWQVVDVGFQVSVPFERTWSCVEDAGEPCWACRGCRAREAAFQQSGKPDPLRGAGRFDSSPRDHTQVRSHGVVSIDIDLANVRENPPQSTVERLTFEITRKNGTVKRRLNARKRQLNACR